MDVEKTVRLARSGDRAALNDLCECFHPQLFRFFMRLSRSPADADDLAQATLLRMMEKLDTFRFLPGRRFEGWLFRIAYRLFIDGTRRDRFVPLPDDAPLPDPSPGAMDRLIQSEDEAEVRAAVRLLDPELQALISLRYELELSYRDIASTMNISPARVKWRLHEALEKLRAATEEKGGAEP